MAKPLPRKPILWPTHCCKMWPVAGCSASVKTPTQVVGWEPGQIGTTAKPVKFGDAQAFKNLDAVVVAHHNEFIGDEFALRPDMVVLCNRKTLGDKYFGYVNEAGTKATEAKAANDLLIANKQLGGLDAIAVPFFPKTPCLSPLWPTCLSTYKPQASAAKSPMNLNTTALPTTNLKTWIMWSKNLMPAR